MFAPKIIRERRTQRRMKNPAMRIPEAMQPIQKILAAVESVPREMNVSSFNLCASLEERSLNRER
jgi:hypothetical protein